VTPCCLVGHQCSDGPTDCLQVTKYSYTLTIEPAHSLRNVGTHENTRRHSPKDGTGNLRSHRTAPHPQAQRSTAHAQVLSSISILILYYFKAPPFPNPCLRFRYLNVIVCIRLLLHMLHFVPIPHSLIYHLTSVSSSNRLAPSNTQLFFPASFLNQTQSVTLFQESWPEDWQCCLRLSVVFLSLFNTSHTKMPFPSTDSLAMASRLHTHTPHTHTTHTHHTHTHAHTHTHRITAIREIY